MLKHMYFKDRNNKDSYCYQTSWGVTTRMIVSLIMVHSDDFGLVLPKIAPVKVAIIKIGDSDKVNTKIDEIVDALKTKEISYMVDDSEKSPGFKFAEAEVNGIPVRIEVGERNLNANKIVLARRDTIEKITCEADSDIASTVSDLLDTIQKDMYQRALERRKKNL